MKNKFILQRNRNEKKDKKYWTKKVTETSNALGLESKVFTKSPKEMAKSLKRSAERQMYNRIALLFIHNLSYNMSTFYF